jgi:hypothetical protein
MMEGRKNALSRNNQEVKNGHDDPENPHSLTESKAMCLSDWLSHSANTPSGRVDVSSNAVNAQHVSRKMNHCGGERKL